MYLDASTLNAETLARAAVILSVLVLLVFSSLSSICVILCNKNLNDATNFYLVSLSLADFLWVSMIVPLSFYSSLVPEWRFMGDNSLVCKSCAYLQIVIMTSTFFTFAWLSIDRFSAFKKPSRYESEHTLTRCKCWIAFTWLTALLGALPIVAKMEANYYHEYEFCVLNWNSASAYSITLGVLVLVPSLCTIIFTTVAIFSAMRKPAELEDVQRTALETDQNFVVTLFVIIAFFLAWLPIIIVHFIPDTLVSPSDLATMKFAFVWLGIGCCSTKWLIYMFTNREFRRYFCYPCMGSSDGDGRGYDDRDDEDSNSDTMPATPRRQNTSNRLRSWLRFCCRVETVVQSSHVSAPVPRHRPPRDHPSPRDAQRRGPAVGFTLPNDSPTAYEPHYNNGGSRSMILPDQGYSRYPAQYGSITQLPPGF